MTRLPVTAETFGPFSPAAKVVLNTKSVGITPEQFFSLCRDNPDLFFELTARKEIVIMPPAGAEGDAQNVDIVTQLNIWAKRHKNGKVFGPSAGFALPNGAIRSPDAAWIPLEKWQSLSRDERKKLPRICPDFVLELRSPSNTLRELKREMTEYIENGAELGWLIDPVEHSVYVYRRGPGVEQLEQPASLRGDPVLAGFVLDLTEMWQEED